ncbi:MAG: isoleucine--tRNA ligase [Bacteroidales bacterium]|nr:isoleucine--tRNA ligase [Bacteroidales bacterium]MBN2820812.1 isoleucine--tRNA ligase [Bacteroidales bacterium]
MRSKFAQYNFNLSEINKEYAQKWAKEKTFEKSIELRKQKNSKSFVFFEGPPSANGMPGIHHVISRTIKDIVCRYKTQKGFVVERKAGWDTHGLPVELSVEKSLNITKEDIGRKISVEEYNKTCRKEVMKYTREWEDLTERMGYWVNMDDPYITYDNRYIESVWFLLKKLYDKKLLYKGYTIQPYSPAAGTGLSSHELNQPGCYRDVKDTTCVAQFKVIRNERSESLFTSNDETLYFLAWTTTPWTLPSNTALAVGGNINYVKVKSFNPYTGEPINVILAKDLMNTYFNPNHAELDLESFDPNKKEIPFKVLGECKGSELEGIQYEQLIDWVRPKGKAFEVLIGDFVTTEDGTGIVHIAPTFGADDYRVAAKYNVAALLVTDKDGNIAPLVDRKGRFFRIEDLDDKFIKEQVKLETYKVFAGKYVKNSYDETLSESDTTIDVDIVVMLKKDNKAFRIEKHTHNYPHCWRTDKPVLYYPLDSWFIKTTALKDKLISLNKTINWKPEATGSGRFGMWLENLVDWNLSRSRYWGTPLPIWRTEDGAEEKCIGSVEELSCEIDKAIKAGVMDENPLTKNGFVVGNYTKANYEKIDLHKNTFDKDAITKKHHVVLVSESGKPMFREEDLIDVWFDSGAMPYAQFHYPFSINEEEFNKKFPADFIAEGVDQTRGWFFTLHAIATMLFDSVAYKNIISNGLVLDKNGNKMSKRLGNAVDPFETIEKYGSDPLRWYMITNAQPWDNLKFDVEGIEEVRRKFFGTLYNTYSFFALYANVDGFDNKQPQVPVKDRPEIDRWIMSLLNSLVKEVEDHLENYEPTRAGRAIQNFVTENLSNWYVRLNRKRFWGGEFDSDKLAAYQTLYSCLETISMLMAPIAPFYSDKIFTDLNNLSENYTEKSVHYTNFPSYDLSLIDKDLEERMEIAQQMSSMILGLRRKVNLKVRQPLSKIMVPVLNEKFENQLRAVSSLILSEVNVKEIEYLADSSDVLVKSIKPNFKSLGPRYGKLMKQIAAAVSKFEQHDISAIEQEGKYTLDIEGQTVELTSEDVEIVSQDIPGWLVSTENKLTVALDITLTEELKQEGIARELINRIQNIRKESGFEVTDKINVQVENSETVGIAVDNFRDYISSQVLAKNIELVENFGGKDAIELAISDELVARITIYKI